MFLRRCLCSVLICFLLGSAVLIAQSAGTNRTDSPRIGVALEGGGALGLAHIGFLQWMEEHRIPVYYVAGTSMGGLVGGIYSTGDSPAEIKAFTKKINWDDVLRGQLAYDDLTFRRKEDEAVYPNQLEFGLKKGLRFAEGFNSGYQVGLILDEVALPYSEMATFNDLPIPFACVATDLVSKKQKVFSSGSLSQALRSTMSLPGIFTPVRGQDAVYVDGGLLDNLPVDVAKGLGADLVIAVHLETKAMDAKEPLSSFGVLGRSISVMIAANELRSMEKADVLVTVPLADYTAMDYAKNDEIVKLGYQAAESKAALLSRFSVDESTWQAYLAQRNSRRRTAPVPQFVEVTGTKPKLARQIERRLADDVGQPVDPVRIGNELDYLSGVGRYSRLGYSMIEKDGKQGLLIRADEKDYSPPLLKALIEIDGTEWDRPQFTIGARITQLDLGGFGSELRTDLMVGSENGLRSEYFHPIRESRWFVSPYAHAWNRSANYYQGSNLVAEYRDREAGGGLDFGYAIDRKQEVRFGYFAAYRKLDLSIGTPELGNLDGRLGVSSIRFRRIGRDQPIIPSKGFDLDLVGSYYDSNPGAVKDFPTAWGRYLWFVPVTKKSSVFTIASAGTTFQYHATGLPPFSLGGSANLLAYGQNEFLTQQYYLFKAGYVHPLWYLPPLFGKDISVLGAYEVAKVFNQPRWVSSVPTDVAGAFVINSLFGPIELGYAYGATGHHKFFYQIGRIF